MTENTPASDVTVHRCSECGARKLEPIGPIVPVWENPEDYVNDKVPDYLGCTDCGIMEKVEQ